LAEIIDTTALTAWTVAAANSKRAPARPARYPRPRVRTDPTDTAPRLSTSTEIRAFFGSAITVTRPTEV
jgi:hypothetical protein